MLIEGRPVALQIALCSPSPQTELLARLQREPAQVQAAPHIFAVAYQGKEEASHIFNSMERMLWDVINYTSLTDSLRFCPFTDTKQLKSIIPIAVHIM